jgi:predicted TIM-barrel fold metal-dependent hydrolase
MPNSEHRLYDSHAHLISSNEQRYPKNPLPLDTSAVPPGVIGLPGGLHGDAPLNLKPSAEQLHDWMKEENVTGIAAVQKGLIYRTDNRYITDAAALFPEEMRAVIIVDPMEEKTLQMIRDFSERGVVGIRFFPVGVEDKIAWLSSEQSLEVWALANELGLIVDVEAPGKDQDKLIPLLENMATEYRDLRIVLDHVFLPNVTQENYGFDEYFERLATYPNIFVKWTSINMDVAYVCGVKPEVLLRHVVDFFGSEKVMWGSDIGTSSGSYAEMVSRAIDSTSLLNESERKHVLHDTGRSVFTGWKPE